MLKIEYFDDYKNKLKYFKTAKSTNDFISILSLHVLLIVNEDYSFVQSMDEFIKNNKHIELDKIKI